MHKRKDEVPLRRRRIGWSPAREPRPSTARWSQPEIWVWSTHSLLLSYTPLNCCYVSRLLLNRHLIAYIHSSENIHNQSKANHSDMNAVPTKLKVLNQRDMGDGFHN